MRRFTFLKKRGTTKTHVEELKNDNYEAITSLPGFTNETIEKELFQGTFEPVQFQRLFKIDIYGVN